MKSTILKLSVSITYLLFSTFSFSQNVTINYQTWTSPGSGCDIFNTATNVPATINGSTSTITHVTTLGDTKYNTSLKAVQLDNKYFDPSLSQGTKYRIAYNFKANYRYIITITSAELNSTAGTSYGPWLRLDLSNSNVIGGSTCIGTENLSPDLSGNPQPVQYNDFNFTDQQFNYTSALSTSYSMLELTSIPAQAAGTPYNSVLIRKITITETPPAFSISLLPPYTSCGSSNPITFTISPNNVAGVSGYTWNLGNASNNWLYNGNPAPQTLSTSTNTLSLVPVCGKVPASVSGGVVLNGSSVNTTNSATLSYNPLSISINGTANLCSGSSNYFVNNLPCNANVTWSLSPSSGIVSASCLSCNQTTLTKQGVGNVTLTATVTNACGLTSSPITKTISTDPNTVITGTYTLTTNGNYLDHGSIDNSGYPKTYTIPKTQPVQYGLDLTNSGLTGVTWSVSGACSNISNSSTYFYCTIPAPGNGASGITVNLHATGPCGTAINNNYSVQILGIQGFVKVSPNPATNSINVILADNPEQNTALGNSKNRYEKRGIEEIKIFDNVGNLKKMQRENKTEQATVNLTGIKPGVYIIEVSDGSHKEKQQIIIQK